MSENPPEESKSSIQPRVPSRPVQIVYVPQSNTAQQVASVIVDSINKVDPDKLKRIVEAVATPFQTHSKQTRRDILIVMGVIVVIMVGVLSWLTFIKAIDANFLVFFFATIFGYVMGFLTRYFIHS